MSIFYNLGPWPSTCRPIGLLSKKNSNYQKDISMALLCTDSKNELRVMLWWNTGQYCPIRNSIKRNPKLAGQVSANEFASCIYDYVKRRIAEDPVVEEIWLISDGCSYQNRNKVLSSMFSDLSRGSGIMIQVFQLILERVHTMMHRPHYPTTLVVRSMTGAYLSNLSFILIKRRL